MCGGGGFPSRFRENSTPYSTYSLNLVIKWNEFTASRPSIFNIWLLLSVARLREKEKGMKKLQAINFILVAFYWLIRYDNKFILYFTLIHNMFHHR